MGDKYEAPILESISRSQGRRDIANHVDGAPRSRSTFLLGCDEFSFLIYIPYSMKNRASEDCLDFKSIDDSTIAP